MDREKAGQKVMGVLCYSHSPVPGQLITFPEGHHADAVYIEDQIVVGERLLFWQIVVGKRK